MDMSRVAGASAWTRFGQITLRIVDALPAPMQVGLGATTVPVLTLLDLEAAHPQLADVLARLRERQAA
jgi:hypothetical protein